MTAEQLDRELEAAKDASAAADYIDGIHAWIVARNETAARLKAVTAEMERRRVAPAGGEHE
jgi:hypothetical protein